MLRTLCVTTVFAAFMVTLPGCADTLETGYKPSPLKDSDTVRRGYYAPAFTPEAKAPQMEREQEFEARRPKPGYKAPSEVFRSDIRPTPVFVEIP